VIIAFSQALGTPMPHGPTIIGPHCGIWDTSTAASELNSRHQRSHIKHRSNGQYVAPDETENRIRNARLIHSRRVKELVSAQPVEEGAQERVCLHLYTPHHFIGRIYLKGDRGRVGLMVGNMESPLRSNGGSWHGMDRIGADGRPLSQYQEAEDQQIPFAQGNRPQVPKKPQACAPRHCQGSGSSPMRMTRSTNPRTHH
jgi:hypothetical protein